MRRLVLLACLARAGAMGNAGIVKWTRAASNPDVPGDFVASLLNGTAQGPEPTREHGACAWYDKLVVNGAAFPDNIQTHFVNATRRPAGNLSVAAFERQLRARFAELANARIHAADDFLELNLALYSPDLDGPPRRCGARRAVRGAALGRRGGRRLLPLPRPSPAPRARSSSSARRRRGRGLHVTRAPTPRVLAPRATFAAANASCNGDGRAASLARR